MKTRSPKNLEATKTVGIWIRVSTEDQAQGESPAIHEKRARRYAEAKGWTVAEVYDLAGVSGKAVMEHPEAKRMLKDIQRGHITGLVFSKLARLARNTKELLEFSEEFRRCGADLISLAEAIDTSSPAGRLFYTMIAAMAQWEREEIAERIRASVPIRAKLGKPLSGSVPFGYRSNSGKIEPHPEHAPIRRLMYELFIEHRRKKAVARILNERGYRTATGTLWSYTTINRLLRDPTAKGIYRSNYTYGTPDGGVGIKPESEWVIHPIEPIVSVELWEQVNSILADQRGARAKPGRKPVNLFSGLTYCTCGQKMYVPSRPPPTYRCHACGMRMRAADLEAIYHEELRGFLFSDAQIAAQQDHMDAVLTEKEERIAYLTREREKAARDMDVVFELYRSGETSTAGFGARNRPLEARVVELDELIPVEQASADILRINRLNGSHVLGQARDLHSRWEALPTTEKRIVVEAITRSITISNEEVHIDLHYVPKASIVGGSGEGSGGMNRQEIQKKSKASEDHAIPFNKATQADCLA